MSKILACPSVLKAVATKDLIVKGNRVDDVTSRRRFTKFLAQLKKTERGYLTESPSLN
ncbi:hypothetical protein YC2023_106238 [Brassica napus]